jgi:hypothetical protein
LIRIISKTGLTAVPGDLQPPVGYQWKLRYVLAIITLGGTAGTRVIQLSLKPNDNPSGTILYLTPGTTSSISTSGETVNTAGGLAIQGMNGAATSYSEWNTTPILNPGDTLTFQNSALISGDTLAYYVSVEEDSVASGIE